MGIGQSTPDITIVGGGIIGCMLAWELTGRGMTVELLANSIVSGSVDAALAPFDPGRFS